MRRLPPQAYPARLGRRELGTIIIIIIVVVIIIIIIITIIIIISSSSSSTVVVAVVVEAVTLHDWDDATGAIAPPPHLPNRYQPTYSVPA